MRATQATRVALFCRGPADWWQIVAWDTDCDRIETGAWFRGKLYPRRSDISADGRWLCYFALKHGNWDLGDTYIAISRLPWLTALAAWPTGGTWTRGCHFTCAGRATSVGPPEFGTIPAKFAFWLDYTSGDQFAAEKRRGFTEAPDSPPRNPSDIFDQNRLARVCRIQPGGDAKLIIQTLAHGEFQRPAIEGMTVAYSLEQQGQVHSLDDVQWADWDHSGRLIVATKTGQIEARIPGGETSPIIDLSKRIPDPQPAPQWAISW